MHGNLDKLAETVGEIRELVSRPAPAGNHGSGNVIFQGSAGLQVIGIAAIFLALLVAGISEAARWAATTKIDDLKDRAAEDRRVIAELQAQARTDRLLLGALKDRITKVEAVK